jgi:hypothetical protein
MRGRLKRQKPTLDAILSVNRQDLALHSLWVPLAAAAEQLPIVRGHPSRGFRPPYDARCDGSGARFMALHTRMIAAPDETELSVGFPSAWTAIVRAKYRASDMVAQIDPTALLIMRLMCEHPVQFLDVALCHLAAQTVLASGCRVRQAMVRCYYYLSHALAVPYISDPAYDVGEMALWMWCQRYITHSASMWECAIYHELGLPYILDNDQCVPAQIWPETTEAVWRSELTYEWDQYEDMTRHITAERITRNGAAQYHTRCGVSMVYYSILCHLLDVNDRASFAALSCVSHHWHVIARYALIRPWTHEPTGYALQTLAPRIGFGAGTVHGTQRRLLASFALAAHMEQKRADKASRVSTK